MAQMMFNFIKFTNSVRIINENKACYLLSEKYELGILNESEK